MFTKHSTGTVLEFESLTFLESLLCSGHAMYEGGICQSRRNIWLCSTLPAEDKPKLKDSAQGGGGGLSRPSESRGASAASKKTHEHQWRKTSASLEHKGVEKRHCGLKQSGSLVSVGLTSTEQSTFALLSSDTRWPSQP